ncbi:MAG TPA: NHLP bacteriocin export ABC transporter permease/ATPase subunit [Gemmatimonadaceae bacterium]|nr:NHLP bacteriocin export ABC transporter permease/ATPase subunit [Gemmatimonadaceae bacterium]
MTVDGSLLTPSPATAALLPGVGAAHDVGSDRPFLLDGDALWLVDAGHVNVFSVPVTDGQPAGSRAYLFRITGGQALFGVGQAHSGHSRALLAVGTSGTRLRRIARDEVRELARQPEHAAVVSALIESWVEALCTGIARGAAPVHCAELDPGEVAVRKPTTLRSHHRVCWFKHLEGHSLLFGNEALRVNGQGFLPLSKDAWMESREQSRLLLVETTSLLRTDDVWLGLDRLHAIVLQCAAMRVEHAAAAEQLRLRRRTEMLRTALRTSCRRLADTIDTRAIARGAPQASESTEGADARTRDPLLDACRLVGRALAIDIHPYRVRLGAPAPSDPLAAIARASRIRLRQVMLRDGWWAEDNGPLLAVRTEDRRPVALLVTPGRGYTMHDTAEATDRGQRVTPELAHTLSPFAYTFYRSFPEKALSIMDVVIFGLQGRARDVATIVLMTIGAALLGMLPPIATGAIFNDVIPGAERSQLLQLTLVLIVCAVSVALFEITRSVALLRIEGVMGNAVQSAVWDRLLSLPMSFFRPFTAGELAVRAMGIDAIRQVISGSTVTAVVSGITSIGNFLLLFHYSTHLALWASLIIAIALAISVLGAYLQLSHQRGVYAVRSKTSGLVLQLLSGITKLRVAGVEAHAFDSWAARFSAQRRLQFRARAIGNWVAAANAGIPTAAYILIYWAAVPLVMVDHTMRTGDFLAFISAFATSLTGVVSVSTALLSMLLTVPLYEQAKPILITPPEVDGAKEDPGDLSGDIEIQHATFRYQADGPPVLRDLTVHITPGEFLAIVGPSGSGKSTILRLLLGFEHLETGSIYYDGRDIGGLDIRAVRRQIGVVLQGSRLMSGDIFTNIAGSSSITMDDAWEAARMAGFADDITAMPMGMHTVISEGGGTLSGGQRQLLMITRAIVHRPRILLFDEATSALDNRTQSIVSESLERLHATRVVIAHRLSTIEHADRICVVQAGQIQQSGTYDELMRQKGLFAKLAQRQLM